MAGLDVQVKGVSKAMGRLRVVLNEEIKRGVEEAVDKTALLTAGRAKRNAPVDTGQLRASGHVEEPGPLRRKVVFDVAHAAPQEFGTRDMPAQPYLGPAWEAEREAYVARVRAALRGK